MNQKYRKQDIVAIGAEIIRQNGYHATGINDILREAGIPKGSFYNFFPSKEAFGEAILTWYGGRILKAMQSILRDERLSPLRRIRKFYQLLMAGHAQEDFLHGCLVNNLTVEVAGGSDRLAEVADAQFRAWMGELTACIEAGQEIGEITTSMPAADLAEFVHTAFSGAFSRMKATRDEVPLQLVEEGVLRMLAMGG